MDLARSDLRRIPHTAPAAAPPRGDVPAALALLAAGEGGLLGEALCHQLEGPGKRLRGRLAVSAAREVGVPGSAALQLALACELLHEASLVHDDLIDGDTARRGRPALWFRFGRPVALLAGDWLVAQAFAAARRAEREAARPGLVELVAETMASLVRGQGEELETPARGAGGVEASSSREKTAPLVSLPVEGALVLAGCRGPERQAARRAMRRLGEAFQLQDDLLDLMPAKGRPAGSDLRAGRRTTPVRHFLARAAPDERHALERFLAAPVRSDEECSRWAARIARSEAAGATLAEIVVRSGSALRLASDLDGGLRRAIRHAGRLLLAPAMALQARGMARERAWTALGPVELPAAPAAEIPA